MIDHLSCPSGPVPVCLADRHAVLSAAPWASAPRARERARPQAFPSHCGGCWGSRPEEWSHALLVPWKTQVMLVLYLQPSCGFSLIVCFSFKDWKKTHKEFIFKCIVKCLKTINLHYLFFFFFLLAVLSSLRHLFTLVVKRAACSRSAPINTECTLSSFAGRGWTRWERCTTVLEKWPPLTKMMERVLWQEMIPSMTVSTGLSSLGGV